MTERHIISSDLSSEELLSLGIGSGLVPKDKETRLQDRGVGWARSRAQKDFAVGSRIAEGMRMLHAAEYGD